MRFRIIIASACAIVALSAPVRAASLLDYVGQCVPFARTASGIQIFGDAWTWWDKSKGQYKRGETPRTGAVIVFARSARLPLGHVAVISRVVDARVVMVTHANWSRRNGARGHAEQDVTVIDVSPKNDWSAVKVWYRDIKSIGSTVYRTRGFVYGNPHAGGVFARPASELSSRNPDYVGALIDAYR